MRWAFPAGGARSLSSAVTVLLVGAVRVAAACFVLIARRTAVRHPSVCRPGSDSVRGATASAGNGKTRSSKSDRMGPYTARVVDIGARRGRILARRGCEARLMNPP